MQTEALTDVRNSSVSGPHKAAILLLYLGESVATDILARLSESEILRIGQSMSTLDVISPDMVDHTVTEFLGRFSGQKGLSLNGMDYMRRVVRSAMGEDRARTILRSLDTKGQEAFERKLTRLNPESLAALMKQEHPQTAAVIASFLGTTTAAKVLSYFPADARNDIIYRMASLERIQPDIMEHVKEFIDREVQIPIADLNPTVPGRVPKSGIERVAELLNALGRSDNELIIRSLSERSSSLADEVAKKMFSFDDLLRVDERGMQALLQEIGKEDLTPALKMADKAVQDKFFRNMSEKAAEFLKEDMDVMGAVRAKDVEISQRKIIAIALRLEEEGKIVIAPKE